MIVEVRNMLGQVVESFNRSAAAKGTFTINVNVSEYSAGVYSVNTVLGKGQFSPANSSRNNFLSQKEDVSPETSSFFLS